MKSMLKLTMRNIRASFMRYLAILLIVMLSVGFFSGLKITRDAMAKTGGDYLTEQHFYDYELISTLGFTEDDVQAFSDASDVQAAECRRELSHGCPSHNGQYDRSVQADFSP